MVSLGHAAFFGIGAYTVGIAMTPRRCQRVDRLAAGDGHRGTGCAGHRLISLRTRGVYFIMITLAFAQMVYYLAVA